ncbi:hypothetical protein [Burkholderia sp. ABCPW 11]|uniref:hypothetical protein n=1 Tax=Burkholderia sp. ABCPW 11 TaxID=1637859 RepID=UPI0012FD30C7|nr:hypothetical protein [Burkholderia sp. ABCPW 11]
MITPLASRRPVAKVAAPSRQKENACIAQAFFYMAAVAMAGAVTPSAETTGA